MSMESLDQIIDEALSLTALRKHLQRQHKDEVWIAGSWSLVSRAEAENMHRELHAVPLRAVK